MFLYTPTDVKGERQPTILDDDDDDDDNDFELCAHINLFLFLLL